MHLLFFPFAFIEGIGGPEMVLILVIVLVLFGGQKLPEFARGLGKSIREFKKAASGVEQEFKRALEEDAQKNYSPPAASQLPPPTPTPELTAGSGYHDDPHHIDPHYNQDESHYGHEAGPTAQPALPAPTPTPTPEPPAAAPATDAPKSDLPKAAAPTPPAAPPPIPPAPDAKP